jgi:hypothetical protein
MISEIYFNTDPLVLRCIKSEKKGVVMLDFDLKTGKCTVKEGEKYEDKGIFKYGMNYIQYHEQILSFLKKENQNGN